jgi:hypothetical protein
VRWYAIAGLHKLLQKNYNEKVVELLKPMINDEDRYVKSAAESTIADLDVKNKKKTTTNQTTNNQEYTILLQNFYVYRRVLEYNLNSLEYREILRDILPESKPVVTKGLYIEINGSFYGVLPTTNSPVFFINSTHIPLEINKFTGELIKNQNKRTFILRKENIEVFSVEYLTDELLFFDPYSGKEEDFFDYIISKLNEDYFFNEFLKY